MTGRVASAILPLRRALSRAALVYEERYFRDQAVNGVYTALAAQGARVGETLRGLEERVILRVDILMEELWRRTESVGARQATELQRLAARLQQLERAAESRPPELERLARQMAEVHQLAAELAELRQLGPNLGAELQAGGGAARSPLVADLLRGIRPPPQVRWEPHIKHLHGLAPVVALGSGSAEFVILAGEAGVDAYEAANTSEHLAALPASSLAGAFFSLVAQPMTAPVLDATLRELARALQPDGVAVIESANPASFASFLEASGRNIVPAPDHLADQAILAGLEVEECHYAPLPARHLAGVSSDLSDPSLREIAAGVNDLVAQLNDVLYGPQEYVLILRRP